ncbi:MAG: hypothetical protein IJC54_08570, partial [Clostridia bacterium]|nr:hypothetical protein [Clostridia bacterium]
MDAKTARARAEALIKQRTVEEMASQLRYDAPAIERLGIPAYNWWNEALHGVARAGTATVFPQAIGLAAMFDVDTVQKIGDVIATEGRAKYNMQAAQGDRDIYKGLTYWSPNVIIPWLDHGTQVMRAKRAQIIKVFITWVPVSSTGMTKVL